ncbi:hypothetical protein [Phycicoccus sp. DTK01]|uniref:hypothetical protein n=1 Tax=Phycicoccus sp. DTK01 TaxID=2785745 RepID=UPI001A8F657E|nr:hypothetical protein [Phycicoccus sp. DTK01]GIL34530.1 hypothetical protein PDTK01_06060 [Phycicoccus sp. DTK01]
MNTSADPLFVRAELEYRLERWGSTRIVSTPDRGAPDHPVRRLAERLRRRASRPVLAPGRPRHP